MPAADFAAAQERIAARRAQRAAVARAQHATSPPPSALARLPFPLDRLSTAGLHAWDAVKGRHGTRPAFRVGQVDAELLDDELLDLLKTQAGEGLKYLGAHLTDTYSAEILLALRAVLFKLSIWNNNASYGAHLQGLRYTDARSTAPSRPPPKPWQKAAYGLLTVGGRYAWSKWEAHLLAADDDYDYTASTPPTTRLATLARLTDALTTAHDVASLVSFLVFLLNGRYRTLTDRLLRLRLTPTSHSTSREVSFEYLNRQLVWHAFTEFLLFLLPLVGISRWRRILSRTVRRTRATFLSLIGRSSSSSDDTTSLSNQNQEKSGPLSFLPLRTCAVCYSDQNPSSLSESDLLASSAGGVLGSASTDVTNPYAAACGCVYCFACIAQRIASEEGEGWVCLRCGEEVRECAAWEGDVVERSKRSEHGERSRHGERSELGGWTEHTEYRKTVLFAQPEDSTSPRLGADDEKNGYDLISIPPMPHTDDDDNDNDVNSVNSVNDVNGRNGVTVNNANANSRSTMHTPTELHNLSTSLASRERDEWARRDESDESDEHDESDEYKSENGGSGQEDRHDDEEFEYEGGLRDADEQSEEYDEDEDEELEGEGM